MAAQQRFKVIFFTPPQALPSIKTALFATGAGAYPGQGNYTEVMFTAPGVGQFKPGDGANPAIGQVSNLNLGGRSLSDLSAT